MQIETTHISGLYILTPQIFIDERGYFFESYNDQKVPEELKNSAWVQDNESQSTRGVLRGIHYQTGAHAQAKLVRAVTGEIYDVAVDLRPESKTYGAWYGMVLSAENKKQLYIPRGFGHAFVVLSEQAIFSYKCDNHYHKASEACLHYNCDRLNISWPIYHSEIIVSKKDGQAPCFGAHRSIND